MSKGLSYKYSGTRGQIISIAASLPRDYNVLLNSGFIDISSPLAKERGYILLKEVSTGLKIRFDKKTKGANGFRGKNHYHIFNPNATSNKNLYLDINGNPVNKGSRASHILPKGE